MDLNLSVHAFDLLDLAQLHSVLPESFLTSVPDISDLLHGLDRLDVHVSIVLHWLVALLFELENRVVCQLFAVNFSVGFGPGEFSWVVFGLEMLVALSTTEFENFTVVTNEGHSMAWVNRTRAEVTLIDSHFNNEIDKIIIFLTYTININQKIQ